MRCFGYKSKYFPMSKTTLIHLVLLFCAMVSVPFTTHATRTVSGVLDYDKARQVVTNLNRLRQANGLKPLKMETTLTEAAMLRAAELAFRAEEEQEDEATAERGKRPGGEGNLKLIVEQGHAVRPKTEFYYIHLSRKPYTDIGTVVKSMKSTSNGSAAFLSSTMRSVGCGSFLSPQGNYYWVLFLLPDGGTDMEIPHGQWKTEVFISTKAGEKTRILSRTKTDENLTPEGFEVTGNFNYSKAIKVVELTNKERTANGLKPYIMDSTLMELAMIRAAEMKGIKKMTHRRPNGENGNYIIYDAWGIILCSGENIARGQGSAEEVMSQWMNSPGHRANILDDYCNRMGAGECDGYWVQLFAKSDRKTPVMSKSATHTDEVTVWVTVVPEGVSKVVKRKKIR